ncbi:hypothetical protein BN946_scf185038.g10 [Trametes cinnabarina]|uniref:Uncharacterized protein n=1 Tax=Pycnoporus cinnabarinus TaxID=5643 RepID=A0A060SB97_PYCCI|nr:hypothetical protein BN946_scf185038.g10 [Trametes cinnabarina]
MRPRYTGPLVVVLQNRGGAYVLCEPDGSVLHRAITVFHLDPYLLQKAIALPPGFTNISQKRLDELISSENNGEDDEEPEVSQELVADAGEDKVNESKGSDEED